MKDFGFKLNDKTVVLTGVLNSITQSLIMALTEQGANVGFVSNQTPEARRFTENICDGREINPQFGRAILVDFKLKEQGRAQEIIAKTTESFGSIDVFIDTLLLPVVGKTPDWDCSRDLAEAAKPFFLGRKRGHTIFLVQDSRLSGNAELNATVKKHVYEAAQTTNQKSITTNAIALGVTEEFLLQKFPKAASIKVALGELQKEMPQARLLDASEIAYAITFLASPLSSAVNGQLIEVNGCL